MSQFEVKVKYRKICEKSGREIVAKETYLVDGATFGDAEEKAFRELESTVNADLVVVGITRANYARVICPDMSKWFKCRVSFPCIDDATGREKKTTETLLIGAANIDDATNYVKQDMETLIVDYDIVSVAESPVVDIFLNFAS